MAESSVSIAFEDANTDKLLQEQLPNIISIDTIFRVQPYKMSRPEEGSGATDSLSPEFSTGQVTE